MTNLRYLSATEQRYVQIRELVQLCDRSDDRRVEMPRELGKKELREALPFL